MNTTTKAGAGASTQTPTRSSADDDAAQSPIKLTRHRLDRILTAFGALVTAVLLVAGGLLWWGSSFAGDYVTRELTAQNISFPDAATLSGQGRDDLVGYAGQQVANGRQAEAYASYIAGHVAAIADGATYAQLGGPERAAKAAVDDAIAKGASTDEITTLEGKANAVADQRETIFRGEMLRGALLNTFAWDTIGRIAGWAAVAAFAAAGLMLILTVAGLLHLRRPTNTN
jgi:hypothetical protein